MKKIKPHKWSITGSNPFITYMITGLRPCLIMNLRQIVGGPESFVSPKHATLANVEFGGNKMSVEVIYSKNTMNDNMNKMKQLIKPIIISNPLSTYLKQILIHLEVSER